MHAETHTQKIQSSSSSSVCWCGFRLPMQFGKQSVYRCGCSRSHRCCRHCHLQRQQHSAPSQPHTYGICTANNHDDLTPSNSIGNTAASLCEWARPLFWGHRCIFIGTDAVVGRTRIVLSISRLIPMRHVRAVARCMRSVDNTIVGLPGVGCGASFCVRHL